ncbi:MAG: hypothetical protein KJ626_10220 [Verrucomicrobia bacterium]|nr:hypothetical protein [Verrucomicrobiota bacterium]
MNLKYTPIMLTFLLWAILSAHGADIILRGTVTLGGDIPADVYLASNQTFTATNTFTKTIQGTATNALTVGGELPAALHDAANLTGTAAAIDGSAIFNVDALTLGGFPPSAFAGVGDVFLGSNQTFIATNTFTEIILGTASNATTVGGNLPAAFATAAQGTTADTAYQPATAAFTNGVRAAQTNIVEVDPWAQTNVFLDANVANVLTIDAGSTIGAVDLGSATNIPAANLTGDAPIAVLTNALASVTTNELSSIDWDGFGGGTSTSDVQTISWTSQRTPYQITSASTVTVLAAWGNLLRLDVAHSPCTITAEASVLATNYTYDATLELYAGTNTIAWNTTSYTNTTLLDISTTKVTVLNINKPQRNTRAEVRQ